jgi:hypothetical protein
MKAGSVVLAPLPYPQLQERISSAVMTTSRNPPPGAQLGISSSLMTKSAAVATKRVPTPLSTEILLGLSWTHLIDLLAIDEPWKRAV